MSNYIVDAIKLIAFALSFVFVVVLLFRLVFGNNDVETTIETEEPWLDAANAVEVWKVLHDSNCEMSSPEDKELYAKLTQLLKEGAMDLLDKNTTNKAQ